MCGTISADYTFIAGSLAVAVHSSNLFDGSIVSVRMDTRKRVEVTLIFLLHLLLFISFSVSHRVGSRENFRIRFGA